MRKLRNAALLCGLFLTCWLLAGEARQADPFVKELLNSISEDELKKTVQALQEFKSRAVGQPGNAAAAEYLHKRLGAIPNLTVEYQDLKLRNVIATLKGADPASSAIFMAGAHYDSTAKDPTNAPGATDDGAGVSVVLEFARILSQRKFKHIVKFAFWNAEEAGLKGSLSYALEAASRKDDIRLYISCDSIGHDPKNRQMLDIMFDKNSVEFKDRMVANNDLYGIGFKLQFNQHTCGGDHVPFVRKGYRALTMHQEDHAFQHTADDTIDKLSSRYTALAGKLGLSVLAELAEPVRTGASAPASPPAPPAEKK
jgi:Zn-dependent M28 family amino/carboxypeptidase